MTKYRVKIEDRVYEVEVEEVEVDASLDEQGKQEQQKPKQVKTIEEVKGGTHKCAFSRDCFVSQSKVRSKDSKRRGHFNLRSPKT